jgi:GPH family glycoside/pentoside/hexuronide:cation symporter
MEGPGFTISMLYAIGCILEAAQQNTIAFYTNSFMLEVVMLPAYVVGIIMMLNRFIDAVNDPIIGYASDNTKSIIGRRRPWLYGSILPMCILYILLWYVPTDDPTPGMSHTARYAAYYLFVYLMFDVALAAFRINYDCLASEMTARYEDRPSIVAKKTLVYVVAGAVASIAQAKYLAQDSVESRSTLRYNYLACAAIVVFIGLPFAVISTTYVRERVSSKTIWDLSEWTGRYAVLRAGVEDTAEVDDNDRIEIEIGAAESAKTWWLKYLFTCLIRDYARILHHRAYLWLSLVNLSLWVVVNVLQSTLKMYVQYVLKREESLFLMMLLRVQLGVFFGLVLCIALHRYISYNKRRTLFITICVWIILCLSLIKQKQSDVVDVGFGMCVAICVLMVQSMLPDVIDDAQVMDQQQMRRDATYYSFFSVYQKIGVGISLGVINFALDYAGFAADSTHQTQAVQDVLYGLYIYFPPLTLSLALIPLYFYPITRQTQQASAHRINAMISLDF